MADLPSNVGFGTVTGKILVAVPDSADVGTNPDATPATGTVTFTARVPYLRNASASPPTMILIQPVVCTLDSDGELIDPQGNSGVKLISPLDPDIDPQNWTWQVSFNIDGFTIPSFDFLVGVDQTIDLNEIVPTAASGGTAGGGGGVTSVNGKFGPSVILVASDVGAEEVGTAAAVVAIHDASTSAHGIPDTAVLMTTTANLVDEDDMVSNLDTAAPTQQSVVNYIADVVTALLADTTNVHGIANTADLLVAADIGTAVQAFSAVLDATTAAFTSALLAKLNGIQSGAQMNPTASEITTAYNSQVAQVSGPEIAAGTATAIRRVSPADIRAMILAHAPGASVAFVDATAASTWPARPVPTTTRVIWVNNFAGAAAPPSGSLAAIDIVFLRT